MKNKIILIGVISLILLSGLFLLTGCVKNENQTTTSNVSTKKALDEFTIGGTTLKFNIDKTFKVFNYKTAEQVKVNDTSIDTKLYYEDKSFYDGNFVFEISMTEINNYSFSEWTYGPKEGEYETKDINNVKWRAYTTTSSDYTTKTYAAEANNSLYVFKVSKYNNANFNLDDLADVFMNGVTKNS